MRGVLVVGLGALIAALAFASPTPASALPAAAAIKQNNYANTDLVEVKRWYKKRYRRRYYRPYRYVRPYRYRPYRYYRPYYRPYYWRRPRVGIWLGW